MFFSFLSLFVFFCKSADIKDQKGLEKTREQALKGDAKSYEVYRQALEKPAKGQTEEEHQDLKDKIIKDLGTIPTDESRAILKEQAQTGTSENRELALQSLYGQKKEIETTGAPAPETKAKIENDTIEVIQKNLENSQKLTESEIKLLGQIPKDEAADLLLKQITEGSDPDYEIIDALGEQLNRRDPKKEDETSAENKISKKQQEEIEAAFLKYLKEEHSEQSKQQILIELYKYYYPDSDEALYKIYQSREYGEDVKLGVLRILSRKPGTVSDRIISELKKEYLSEPGTTMVNLIINRLKNIDPYHYIKIVEDLDAVIAKKKRALELLELGKKDQMILLKEVLKKYKVDKSLIDKIHQATIKVSQDPSKPMKAETAIVYSAMESLYPHKNFFEIRKIALKGFHINGLFYSIMAAIDRDYEKYDMKILAIRSIWSIDRLNAERLFNAYRAEREFLRAIIK